MPTQEELEAAVQAAVEKATKEAEASAEAKIKAAANGRFTQEDLDRVAGDARSEGRKVAERDVLKGLGVADLETAKATIEAAKKLEDDQKTESQKAQEEIVRLRGEAEAANAEARNSRIQSALELRLRDSGLNPERSVAAMRLVDLSKLDVKGVEVVGLDDAVTELKAQSPEWFGVRTSPPDASRGGTAPTDFRTASPEERDKALAKFGVRL